jgi:hypothetical protein
MSGGIRPGVWVVAAALLAAALPILRLGVGGDSDRQPARAASLDRSSASRPDGSAGVRPAAALRPAPLRSDSERVEARRDAVPARQTAAPAGAPIRAQPASSRAISDLRVVEDEAARRAEALGLAPLALTRQSVGAAPDTADEDTRRSALAEAFLVDQIVQEALRNNEYPLGYPAEARERAFAESLVRGSDAAARSDLLERALQQSPAERVVPRFDGQLWEGAIY